MKEKPHNQAENFDLVNITLILTTETCEVGSGKCKTEEEAVMTVRSDKAPKKYVINDGRTGEKLDRRLLFCI